MNALDKCLKKHADFCKHYEFSGDRHCSCGRDAALKEVEELRAHSTLIPAGKWSICAEHNRGYYTDEGCLLCKIDMLEKKLEDLKNKYDW